MKVLPILIRGSRHIVVYMGKGDIIIECVRGSLDTWNSEYQRIGKNYCYSDQQLIEYKGYIDFIAKEIL